MLAGIPATASPIVDFNLAGPKNGGQGFYERTRTTGRRASRRPGRRNRRAASARLADRPRQDGRTAAVTRRCTTASARGSRSTFDSSRSRSACRRRSPAPSVWRTRAIRLCGSRGLHRRCRPTCRPRRPEGFPQTPPLCRRASSRTSDRRHDRDAIGAHGEFHRRPRVAAATSRSRVDMSGGSGAICSVRRDVAMPLNLVDTGRAWTTSPRPSSWFGRPRQPA